MKIELEKKDIKLTLQALLEASENENYSETLRDKFYTLYWEIGEQLFHEDFTPVR